MWLLTATMRAGEVTLPASPLDPSTAASIIHMLACVGAGDESDCGGGTAAVAVLPGRRLPRQRQGQTPERINVEKNVEEGVEHRPDWLPDGWVMEVKHGEDGAPYQYFVSPVSGFKFRMKAEKVHEWLPKGWLGEIRAGGENMDKMFKFYVHPAMGVRVFSKEDVLLSVKEMKITECDTDGHCDTNSQDNILALLEFNLSELPQGWVKEIVYRRTRTGIKKYPYYTDPVSQYAFRTLKAALRFLETGEVTNRQFIQKTSVHDLYSFEKSADLHESLHKRLANILKYAKIRASSPKPRGPAQREKINCNGQTSYSSYSIMSSPG
ncbi:hypothetical protein ACQ4PT_043431 [Festuca glaucescens]